MGAVVGGAVVLACASPLAASSASAGNAVSALISIATPATPDPAPVAVTVDDGSGQAYVANTFACTVSVIDTTTRAVTATIPHGATSIGDGPTALAVDPEHHQVYVANYNSNTVSVVDTTTNIVTNVIPPSATGIGDGPSAVAIDPEVHKAYVTNLKDGTVSVIDTTANTVTGVIPHDSAAGIGSFVTDVAVDTVAHRAYVVSLMDESVAVLDTRTDRVISVIPHGLTGIVDSPRQIAVDSSLRRAFVTNEGSDSVSVIDTTSNTVVSVISSGVGLAPFSIEFDAVGGQVWVESETQIAAIDTRSLEVTGTIRNGKGSDFGRGIQSIAADPANRRAYVTGSRSATVAVLDLDVTAPLARRSGDDRYATAAGVSAAEFAPGVATVYIASGENFPDALSGSAAAGRRGVPVLLATKNGIPTATGAELARLKAKQIVVLGGAAAIGESVEQALRSYGPVTRIGGADRFAVSAAISRENFSVNQPVVYIASGENFPDALSGGAAAANIGSPVLLVNRSAIPKPVADELTRLQPGRIVVLGGENAVAPAVETALQGISPTTRIAGADRFEVSAAISRTTFTAGADVVYIASGTGFADALAGGPAATVNGAPMLLVRPDGIPAAIAAEVRRLDPSRIVVLGGAQAVSAAVYAQIRELLY
jgi:YVTN family beta-propeller protein